MCRLDPGYPVERVGFMVVDAAPVWWLVGGCVVEWCVLVWCWCAGGVCWMMRVWWRSVAGCRRCVGRVWWRCCRVGWRM